MKGLIFVLLLTFAGAPEVFAQEECTDPLPVTTIPSPEDIRDEMLAAHARARSAVGLGPLNWSLALVAHAQQWTDHLKQTRDCGLQHRSGEHDRGYGENLFGFSGSATPSEVVESWESEKAHFNAASNSCAKGQVCGHYTQIVWRKTSEVGCAVSVCEDRSQVWACNYHPAGNYYGQKPF